MVTKLNNKGFTLIETILACVVLCASILTLGAISTRSLSGIRLNRQHEKAIALVEKQLVLIDYIGIEKFIKLAQMEGDFKQLEPVYHWMASAKQVGIDNLYEVKVTVIWTGKNHNYDVSACTRFNGTGAIDKAAGL